MVLIVTACLATAPSTVVQGSAGSLPCCKWSRRLEAKLVSLVQTPAVRPARVSAAAGSSDSSGQEKLPCIGIGCAARVYHMPLTVEQHSIRLQVIRGIACKLATQSVVGPMNMGLSDHSAVWPQACPGGYGCGITDGGRLNYATHYGNYALEPRLNATCNGCAWSQRDVNGKTKVN